eukprot:gene6657-7971_t
MEAAEKKREEAYMRAMQIELEKKAKVQAKLAEDEAKELNKLKLLEERKAKLAEKERVRQERLTVHRQSVTVNTANKLKSIDNKDSQTRKTIVQLQDKTRSSIYASKDMKGRNLQEAEARRAEEKARRETRIMEKQVIDEEKRARRDAEIGEKHELDKQKQVRKTMLLRTEQQRLAEADAERNAKLEQHTQLKKEQTETKAARIAREDREHRLKKQAADAMQNKKVQSMKLSEFRRAKMIEEMKVNANTTVSKFKTAGLAVKERVMLSARKSTASHSLWETVMDAKAKDLEDKLSKLKRPSSARPAVNSWQKTMEAQANALEQSLAKTTGKSFFDSCKQKCNFSI